MLDHLPQEVVIAIATIVSLFALSLLCLCWILHSSAKNKNDGDARGGRGHQHQPADDDRCGCCLAGMIRRCCCCCGFCGFRNGLKRNSSTSLREFDSLNELVFEIDGHETARLTTSNGETRNVAAARSAFSPEEVSLDTLFPDLLQGHKVASPAATHRDHGNQQVVATELEEPLL